MKCNILRIVYSKAALDLDLYAKVFSVTQARQVDDKIMAGKATPGTLSVAFDRMNSTCCRGTEMQVVLRAPPLNRQWFTPLSLKFYTSEP